MTQAPSVQMYSLRMLRALSQSARYAFTRTCGRTRRTRRSRRRRRRAWWGGRRYGLDRRLAACSGSAALSRSFSSFPPAQLQPWRWRTMALTAALPAPRCRASSGCRGPAGPNPSRSRPLRPPVACLRTATAVPDARTDLHRGGSPEQVAAPRLLSLRHRQDRSHLPPLRQLAARLRSGKLSRPERLRRVGFGRVSELRGSS